MSKDFDSFHQVVLHANVKFHKKLVYDRLAEDVHDNRQCILLSLEHFVKLLLIAPPTKIAIFFVKLKEGLAHSPLIAVEGLLNKQRMHGMGYGYVFTVFCIRENVNVNLLLGVNFQFPVIH